MAAIFLTHTDDARARYYGEEALERLCELGDVRLLARVLSTETLDEGGSSRLRLLASSPVDALHRLAEALGDD